MSAETANINHCNIAYCRTSPIIIPDKCFSSRRLCSFYHLTSITQRPRQRFFAGNMKFRATARRQVRKWDQAPSMISCCLSPKWPVVLWPRLRHRVFGQGVRMQIVWRYTVKKEQFVSILIFQHIPTSRNFKTFYHLRGGTLSVNLIRLLIEYHDHDYWI